MAARYCISRPCSIAAAAPPPPGPRSRRPAAASPTTVTPPPHSASPRHAFLGAIDMRHIRHAALLAALTLAAPPLARACDPEEMSRQLTIVWRGAFDPAAAWVGTLRDRATAAERGAIDAALRNAEEACDSGDPTA